MIQATAAVLFTLALLPAAPFGASPAYAATAAASAALQEGVSGPAVSTLQTSLKTLGYFTYPGITAYYGSITAKSVSDFQKAYSLPVTGSADNVTQIAITRAVVKQKLLQDANSYMYTPYVWGGSTPDGFDCSGFVYYMFTKHGVAMARESSSVMATRGFAVDKSRLMPGDLVFFDTTNSGGVSHVGIYVGNGQFISATRSKGIYIQSMETTYWTTNYKGARRYY